MVQHRDDNLSKEDELELGRRIQAGEKAKEDIKEAISTEEKNALQQVILDGEDALYILTSNYINLARRIAHNYHKKTGTNYPIEDLIQDAFAGLMHAANTYDPSMNCKLSTHAYYRISKEVSTKINMQRFIRLPENKMGEYNKLNQAEREWNNMVGDKPELMDYLIEETGLSKTEIDLIYSVIRPVVSLQTPVNDDNSSELLDLVEDSNETFDMAESFKELDSDRLIEVLSKLSDYERDLLSFEYNAFPATMDIDDFLVSYNMEGADLTKEARKVVNKLKKFAKNMA